MIKITSLSLFTIFALGLGNAFSEAIGEVEWVYSAGGPKHDKTRCVNIDKDGNVLLAGEISGPVKFGEVEVAGVGQLDMFVAKLDSSGKLLWVRTGGGSGVDRAYAVAADAGGNIYVGGHYSSSDAEWSGVRLPLIGEYDLFLAKYSASGDLLWVKTGGGPGYDYVHGLAVDPSGNVVVVGAMAGSSALETTRFENGPGGHLFCAKYDPEGALLWARSTSGKAAGSGHGVATDGRGNIYVGGMNSGVGEFGGRKLETVQGQEALVASLTPSGEVEWLTTYGGTPSCLVHEITCDQLGRVWVAGMFRGGATFGHEKFVTSGDKDNDAFVAHIGSGGDLKWVRVAQGKGTDYGLGVATDGEGNSFWCGTFAETVSLAGASLTSRGSSDIHLSAFDLEGNRSWTMQMGGVGGDNAYSLAYDRGGFVMIGGAHGADAQFGGYLLKDHGGGALYGGKIKVPIPTR